MNENNCKSFVMGMRCKGHDGSEMCGNCPCLSPLATATPQELEIMRFYEDQKKPALKASEKQVGGTHYTDMGIQPFEFTYANYGYIGLKAAVHTKVNKYLGRVKDNEVEQLKKARHCLDILIEKAELQ
ncbi:hypothetical protein VPHD530_0039 [Vibrio phage D530]